MEDGDDCPLGVCFVECCSCSLDFLMICMVMIMSRSLLPESAALVELLEAQSRSAGSLVFFCRATNFILVPDSHTESLEGFPGQPPIPTLLG